MGVRAVTRGAEGVRGTWAVRRCGGAGSARTRVAIASPLASGSSAVSTASSSCATYAAISSSSLGELVDADLPGAGLLRQVAERHGDVEQVLDPREQRERGLGARRLGDVVRYGGPQRHRRDAGRGARVLQHADDPGRVPRTATARSRASSASALSLDVPLTGTGRVCGVSASSAPSVTTISTPRSRATSEQLAARTCASASTARCRARARRRGWRAGCGRPRCAWWAR